MCELSGLVSECLAFREARGLGPNRKLERLLIQFTDALPPDRLDGRLFTQGEALAWAHAPVGAAPAWLAYRLSAVRGFAVYLAGSGLPVGVPGTRQGPSGSRRAERFPVAHAATAITTWASSWSWAAATPRPTRSACRSPGCPPPPSPGPTTCWPCQATGCAWPPTGPRRAPAPAGRPAGAGTRRPSAAGGHAVRGLSGAVDRPTPGRRSGRPRAPDIRPERRRGPVAERGGMRR